MIEFVYKLKDKFPVYEQYSGKNNYYGSDFRYDSNKTNFGLEFRVMDLVPLSTILWLVRLIFLIGIHIKELQYQ